jgi:hypothetical protein
MSMCTVVFYFTIKSDVLIRKDDTQDQNTVQKAGIQGVDGFTDFILMGV